MSDSDRRDIPPRRVLPVKQGSSDGERQKRLWLAVRRGLIQIANEIGKEYDLIRRAE